MKQLLKAAPAVLLATSMAFGLAACGKHEDKVATQVAAKVGSEEISVHQINLVLNSANTNGATPEAVKGMSREVLEKLIDQQLAISQATEKKLDRTPEVVAQIEASKRDILARAYVQQLVAALPKPSADEAKKYYLYASNYFVGMKRENFTDLTEKLDKEWGIWHEVGHTHQQQSWTWSSIIEVNTNIF